MAAGDFLVGSRGREPIVTFEGLVEAAQCLHRTKGARAREWALSEIRFGADSRPESLLRLLLRANGYRDLRVNEPVDVLGGTVRLHPDLSIPSLRLAVEYEGDHHRIDPQQWQDDIERRDLVESPSPSDARGQQRHICAECRLHMNGRRHSAQMCVRQWAREMPCVAGAPE